MNEILHANIFFLIASVGFVVLTLIAALILFHIYKIVRAIRRMIERLEAGSDLIVEDVAQLRSFLLEGSFVSRLVSFFMATTKQRRRSRKTDEEVD